MRIEPKSDFIVCRRPNQDELPIVYSGGGIELPVEEIMKKQPIGLVVAAGPGYEEDDGTVRPMRSKIGDIVICQPKCGEFHVVHEGQVCVMVRDAAVAGIVKSGV